jgi:hypothetical protein
MQPKEVLIGPTGLDGGGEERIKSIRDEGTATQFTNHRSSRPEPEFNHRKLLENS